MDTTQITRESKATGRLFTRTVYIVRDWNSYIGLETGRPVIIRNHPEGPEQYEILSAAEQAATVKA